MNAEMLSRLLCLTMLCFVAWWFLPHVLLSVLSPVKAGLEAMIQCVVRWRQWLIARKDAAQRQLEQIDAVQKRKS